MLVAVSGGADSVALLRVLCEIGPSCGVTICAAHFEHGIRGEESLADATFVEKLCDSMSVGLFMGHGDVPAIAKSVGQSLETAARDARYAFFYETAAACGAKVVALAHHRDDQAETLLLNLMRGSGLRGLSGMPVSRPLCFGADIRLVRPFLCVTRNEIEDYIKETGLEYRDDATNLDTAYTRNRVRHNLIPILREYNPNIVSALSHAAQSMSVDDDMLSGQAIHIVENAGKSLYENTHYGARIHLEELSRLHPALSRRVIRIFFCRLGIMDVTYDQIALAAAGQAVNLPGGWICERFRNMLCVISPRRKNREWVIETQAVVAILASRLLYLPAKNPYRCFINYDALLELSKFGRIIVRGRKPGDRIHPLGAKGSQKLKQYLIDKGIERPSRDDLPLLMHETDSGASALWVPGCGVSQLVAVPLPESGGVLVMPKTRILHIEVREINREVGL